MAPEQRTQLDLFNDSADAVAERELVAALRSGRRAEARERAQRLADLRSEHPRLADLEVLVMGLGLPAEPPADPADHLAVVAERLVPVAQRRLGDQAPDYLGPQWRALADRLVDAPFDPERPRLHASYSALRAGTGNGPTRRWWAKTGGGAGRCW
ncbi:MAG: hypothetical protein ABEJ96_01175 [Thiohalorhabdaceae bacterium]